VIKVEEQPKTPKFEQTWYLNDSLIHSLDRLRSRIEDANERSYFIGAALVIGSYQARVTQPNYANTDRMVEKAAEIKIMAAYFDDTIKRLNSHQPVQEVAGELEGKLRGISVDSRAKTPWDRIFLVLQSVPLEKLTDDSFLRDFGARIERSLTFDEPKVKNNPYLKPRVSQIYEQFTEFKRKYSELGKEVPRNPETDEEKRKAQVVAIQQEVLTIQELMAEESRLRGIIINYIKSKT